MNLPPRPEPVELNPAANSVIGHTPDQLRARELEVIEACKAVAESAPESFDGEKYACTPWSISAAIDKLKEQL